MIPSCELNTFNNDSYKWIQRILKTSWMTYVLVLLGAVFGGGSLIRLYGNTCGLSIIEPSSWLRAFITIGSPWCKLLNWVGYVTTNIVEHLWFHLFGIMMTSFVTFLPSKLKNLKVGQYTDERTTQDN